MMRHTSFVLVVVVFSPVIAGFAPPLSPLLLNGQWQQQQQTAQFPTFSTTPSYSPHNDNYKHFSPRLRCPIFLRYANTAADAPTAGKTSTADNRHLDSVNPWVVLGLNGASTIPSIDEIKRRYKQLAKLHHPDKNPNSSPEEKQLASERFCKINSAYEKAVAIVAAKTTAAAARAAKQNQQHHANSGGGGSRPRGGGSGSPFGNAWSSSSSTTNPYNHYTQHHRQSSPPPPPPPRSAHTTNTSTQQQQRQQAWYSHTAPARHGPYQQPHQQQSASSTSYTQQQQPPPPHNNNYRAGANAGVGNSNNNRAWYEPYDPSATTSSSGYGWEHNSANGYASSSSTGEAGAAASTGYGWERNPNGYSSPASSSSSKTSDDSSRTASTTHSTASRGAAAQSDFSSSSKSQTTTSNSQGMNNNPSGNTASSSSSRHASTTTTAGGAWPKSNQQSYSSYTKVSTTGPSSTPTGTAASSPSRNGYGAASGSTTGASSTPSQGWTNPFKAPAGSQQGYSTTTSGGGGTTNRGTTGAASTTSKTTPGTTPNNNNNNNSSGSWTQPYQTPPKDVGFQNNGRASANDAATTRKTATTSASAAPSTKRTGSTYASSTTTRGGTTFSSTSRAGTSAEVGPKTSKTVPENKRVTIDLGNVGSNSAESFAKAFLARFGRAANAAAGQVFDDLVVFLDNHLKSDMSKSSLDKFLRTGTLEQVGKELEDMELLVQSLSTLSKSIQDEIVKARQQKNVELEKRQEQVTSYLVLARKRLSTVTSKYWELVWDKSRGATASTSTTTSQPSSSSPSSNSKATASSTTVSTTTTRAATTFSRSASSAPTSSDTKSTVVNNDNKRDNWKRQGLGWAQTSGNAPSTTSTSGSVSSSSISSSTSNDKKGDDWIKKAFESFSGLKDLQEILGKNVSKDNEKDNKSWKPKGFGSFGRTAKTSTATASSSTVEATTTNSNSPKENKINDWLKRGVDSLSGLKEDLQERLVQQRAAADVAARAVEADQKVPDFLTQDRLRQQHAAADVSTRAVETDQKTPDFLMQDRLRQQRAAAEVSTRAVEADQKIPDFLKKSTVSESTREEVTDWSKRGVDSLQERLEQPGAATDNVASPRAVEVVDAEWASQKIPDFLKKSTPRESTGEEVNDRSKRGVDSSSGLKDVQEILGQRGAAEVSTRFVEIDDAEWVGPKVPDFLKQSMASDSTVSEAVADKIMKQGILNKFKRHDKAKNKMEIRCVPMGTNRIDFSDIIKKNNPAYVDYLEQELQARKLAVPTNKDGTPSFAKMKKSLKDWVASKDKQAKIDPKLLNSFTPKRQELWGELQFKGSKCNNWTSPSDVADRDEMFFVFLMGVWRR